MAEPQEEERNGNGRPFCSSLNFPRHFFKIILSPKLILPEGFLKEFGDDLACVAKLRDPNEHVWQVGVEKCGESVWFGDNWKDFLNYYSIGHGHFVVFKYEGNSCFRVLIFDSTACEITYPIQSPTVDASLDHNRGCFHEDGNNREPEMVDDELAIVDSFHQTNSHMDNIDDQVNDYERDTTVSQKANKQNAKYGVVGKRRMCRSLRRDVTEEERLDAFRRAYMFRSENPFFVVPMRPHHIQNPHVYVEMSFCSKYMSGPPGWVSLEVADGRHWRVSYRYNQGPDSGKSLRRGWAAFYRENLLEEGDVCVFELINAHQPDLVFKVEIFRVVPINGVGEAKVSEPDRTLSSNIGTIPGNVM